jgi:predicted GNAT family acetyltransferase
MQAQWIESNHPIFDSAAYQRDAVLFNVLNRVINPTAFLRLSDGEYYIIARNRADLAAWVWTRDDIPEDKLADMLSLLRVHFAGRRVYLTAKVAVAKLAQASFESLGFHMQHSLGLLAYRLDTLKEVQPIGQPCLAVAADIDTLCEYQRCFHRDCFGQELPDDPREGLIAAIENRRYWVLRVDGAIASTARITLYEAGRAIVVNQVYTHPSYRGRGCAKYLVATAIAPHIAQGMHAVLYADSKNPFSNAAYRRIGFELQGELLEIQMTQEERTP